MRSEWESKRAQLNSMALYGFLRTWGAMYCCLYLLFVGATAYGLGRFAAQVEWRVVSAPPPLGDDEILPMDLDDYFEACCQWEEDWIFDQRRRLGFSYQPIDVGTPPPCPLPPPPTWGERKKELTRCKSRPDQYDDYPVTEDPDVY